MCIRQKDMPNAFLCTERRAPELSIVLTTDIQLRDISRFCLQMKYYSIFGVDLTFNICSYNATASTNRRALLKVRENKISPVVIGPVLIPTSKTFAAYFLFTSTKNRLKPELATRKVIGKDEENNASSN